MKNYWNSLYENDKKESYKSNPDLLGNTENTQSEELIAILTALDEGGEQVLTRKQRRAFQLVVRENKTEVEAAKMMNCSPSTLRGHVQDGAKKLRMLCQTELGDDNV